MKATPACGLNHSGPDQRDEPGDQRLEQLLPYRCGQGGVHRPGPFHVPARPALYETTPPEKIGRMENAEVLGTVPRSTGPVGLSGQTMQGDASKIRVDEDRATLARPQAVFP